MIALYKQAPKSSIVPGNFIAKTDVKAGSADIGSWDTIKEENVFFLQIMLRAATKMIQSDLTASRQR